MESFALDFLDLSSNCFVEEFDLVALKDMRGVKFLDLTKNRKLKCSSQFIESLKVKIRGEVKYLAIEKPKKKMPNSYKNIELEKIEPAFIEQDFFNNKKELFGIVIDFQE